MSQADPKNPLSGNIHMPYEPGSHPQNGDRKLSDEEMQRLRSVVSQALACTQEANSALKWQSDSLGQEVKDRADKLKHALAQAQAVLKNLSGNVAKDETQGA